MEEKYFRLKHYNGANELRYDVFLQTTQDPGMFLVMGFVNEGNFEIPVGDIAIYSPDFLETYEKHRNGYFRYEITYYKNKDDFIEYLI